jgi:hypothetical protein
MLSNVRVALSGCVESLECTRTRKVLIFVSVSVCKYLSPIDAPVEGVNEISMFLLVGLAAIRIPGSLTWKTGRCAPLPPISWSQLRLIFYRIKIYVRDSNSGRPCAKLYIICKCNTRKNVLPSRIKLGTRLRVTCTVPWRRISESLTKMPGKSQLRGQKSADQSKRSSWMTNRAD